MSVRAGGGGDGAAAPAPLGWCVPHLQRGERVAAAALSGGTSMCEDCAVAAQDDLDALPGRMEDEVRTAAERLFGHEDDDLPGGGFTDHAAPPLRLVLGARDRP